MGIGLIQRLSIGKEGIIGLQGIMMQALLDAIMVAQGI